MTLHNRRGKAKEANNKEKKAQMYNQRPYASQSGKSNGSNRKGNAANQGTSSSYLSSATPASERLQRLMQYRRAHPTQNDNNNNKNNNNSHKNSTLKRGANCTNASTHTFDEGDFFDAQIFDYLIVVDVEATCIEAEPESSIALSYPHEIIEFPAVLIDVRRGLIDKEHSFHAYVKPLHNPTLSTFCTELTGITQSQVNEAEELTTVIDKFVKWFTDTIPRGAKVVFAADGPWDFQKFFIESHAIRDSIALPTMFYEYIDVRTTFASVFNRGKLIKLDAMLRAMSLQFDGRPHCGFDDAYNIARLAVEMMRNGCVFDFLVNIPLHSKIVEISQNDNTTSNDSFIDSNSYHDTIKEDKDVTTKVDDDGDSLAIMNYDNSKNENVDNNSNNINCEEKTDSTPKKRKAKAKAKQKKLLSSQPTELVKETRYFYYPIPGYPVYRRAEGSGHLDKDVVDDIAKNAFGADYFTFGEKHMREVREYRQNTPNKNNNNNNNSNSNSGIVTISSNNNNSSKNNNNNNANITSSDDIKTVVKKISNKSSKNKSMNSPVQGYLLCALLAAMVCIILLLLYCAYILSTMRSNVKL